MNLKLCSFATRVSKSSFVKNILIIISGTAAAQAIGFALTPLISRLFSPSDFGIAGSFGAVVSIVSAGVTLDYSQAIMLPKEKEKALNLFVLSCFSTFAVTCICVIVCVVKPEIVMGLIKTNASGMLVLLVLSVFVNGINVSCQAWCVRLKAFKKTSASQVVRGLSCNGMQMGFGYVNGGSTGLIISGILADILATINLILFPFKEVFRQRRCIIWDRVRKLAWEYWDFPIYSASQNVINGLSSGLPILLLTQFYGIGIAGAYAFGMRILTAPIGLVTSALRQVLFQKAGETQHNGGSLASLYIKISVGMFAIAIFPSSLLLIYAPEIFNYIFGGQWMIAGEFAQSLIFWMMFAFCNIPAVLFARIIRIQRTVFIFDLILLSSRATMLIVGGIWLSAAKTILLFSLLGGGMNLVLIVLVGGEVVKREGKKNWTSIRRYLTEFGK